MSERLLYLILLLPAFVTALTVHEFAHAWAGYKLGDDTAKRQGRLTLDPLAHLDPIGFAVMAFAIFFQLPLIGWAKPVPFNPRNLNNPRRDSILIAIAGPISNVLQMFVWLALLWVLRMVAQQIGLLGHEEGVTTALRAYTPQLGSAMSTLITVFSMGVVINVMLAVFNMIPLPPLDGHYVLEGLGPPFITDLYNVIRPWSFLLLLLLIQTPIFDRALDPFASLAWQAVSWVLGIS